MYAELHASMSMLNVRDAYRTYSRVLRVATDQKTEFETLHLGSLYAKIDYLTREYRLDRNLVRIINDTRVRLRRLITLTDEELEQCRLYDLKSIGLFISVLYGESVPGELLRVFPADSRHEAHGDVVAENMRLYVKRADQAYLYGTCEELPDVEEVCVCYYYNGGTGNGDNRYLRQYLYKGVQLNLVRPTLQNGVYFPELIILEPDYLVDITTVCSCFEEYAHDARISLLNKLKTGEDTEATMLGNLAGQLLDEEVNSGAQERPYSESYTTFIRQNAFKALTVKIDKLREEGEKQQLNIRRALRDGLHQRLGRYDRSQVMLEPSFISETLGLQGRMDFLQLDCRVLIEQKSGKGQWRPGLRDEMPPIEQLKHRVQVLLYQAILHYNHQIPNRDIQLLLLYSKYEKGLIGVTPAPQLLYEALCIRNEIAGQEIKLAKNGFDLLNTLKPDDLRVLEVRDSFWQTYKLPELKQLLEPIQQASALERAYFLRFMQFIAVEHSLGKLGNKTKESSGFAATWHDSLEEKYQTGNIYDQLTLVSPDVHHKGMVTELVFAFSGERASEMSNFRTGDIVIAYQYALDAEPDARRAIVLRGTIADIGAETLRIELRAPQSDKRVLHSRIVLGGKQTTPVAWAVEHDFLESSYRSLYSGMHSFLTAPKQRRELLLLQRKPVVNHQIQLRGNYGRFDELALHVKQAQDFFLIIGPPGTGKTSYGMLYTLQEQLREEGSQVLITSFTNRAVDEVCSKLVEEGIDFIRIGNPVNCSAEYRSHVLSVRLSEAQSMAEMQRIVKESRVVIGTTSTLSSNLPLFRLKTFDLAIIDEASQILEPHLMGLLSAKGANGQSAIRKFVMIGDHKQLPAVVQQRAEVSQVDDALLHEIGLTDCRLSLFERLLTRYRHNPEVVYMLTRQGRMHRDIADWPNQAFYGGKLQVVPLEHQVEETLLNDAVLQQRVTFIDVPTVESVVSDKVNRAEAECIAELVLKIYVQHRGEFDALKTVGVIVPYRNQIAAVRNAIDIACSLRVVDYGISDIEAVKQQLHGITIDTVERYQGSQRDYVLYGMTVQRPYQLSFLTNNCFEEDGVTIDRKLNVAMTRARKYLVILGDEKIVSKNPLFAQLIAYIKNQTN